MIEFQSTRPARGATTKSKARINAKGFQSTRPARGATGLVVDDVRYLLVSIHAPRTGRDARLDGILDA